jgi:asparagine synthase (glutamine-hydrolysing)
MCGIIGLINIKNSNDIVDHLNNLQSHRGPDFQGKWNKNNVTFGHQRLSIIDLSNRSNQPFIKDDLVIVFNGEIYNFQLLKNNLESKGITFSTTSDTEVVLEMYRYYHEKSLDYLEGMFAFSIYNTSTKKTFIARDHFGIKPLFYTFIKEGFAFASELKTLVELPGFDRTINVKSLVSCLNYVWVSGNESMFQNCFKLPAAHYMTIDNKLNVEIQQYWELKEKSLQDSEERIIQDLELILEDSIERHMVSDVPVSSFLSGGLDSSLISVLAKKHNSKLATYTIGTEQKDKQIEQMPEDEKYAKKLAEEFDFDHHEIIIKSDIVKSLPDIVRTLDEPIGDPAAINTYLICKEARDQGVKVLLSGMGADEIFFGYRRQKATLYAMRYKKVPKIIRRLIETVVDKLPVVILGRGIKTIRWSKKFLSFASLPLEKAYMQSYSYYNDVELSNLLKPHYHQGIKDINEEHKNIFNKKFLNDPVNQMCFTDINMFMQGLNLTYSDRASMATSVEVRVPFIDKTVIEYGMSIPSHLKFKKGESKYILKKAAEKTLPNNIIYRPKASFGAPIRSWISNELKPLVDDLLSQENIEKRNIFNYDEIKTMIDEDRNGIKDNAYRIYQLLTLELWYREFVDIKEKK